MRLAATGLWGVAQEEMVLVLRLQFCFDLFIVLKSLISVEFKSVEYVSVLVQLMGFTFLLVLKSLMFEEFVSIDPQQFVDVVVVRVDEFLQLRHLGLLLRLVPQTHHRNFLPILVHLLNLLHLVVSQCLRLVPVVLVQHLLYLRELTVIGTYVFATIEYQFKETIIRTTINQNE